MAQHYWHGYVHKRGPKDPPLWKNDAISAGVAPGYRQILETPEAVADWVEAQITTGWQGYGDIAFALHESAVLNARIMALEQARKSQSVMITVRQSGQEVLDLYALVVNQPNTLPPQSSTDSAR